MGWNVSKGILFALVLIVTAACSAETGQVGDGSGDVADAGRDAAGPEVQAVTSPTPNVLSAALEGDHAGWGAASCGECHALVHGGPTPAA